MLEAASFLVTALAFCATEVFAWALHRHVMHGIGWGLHRSHHEPRNGWFESNDLYALVFVAVSIGLFALGARPGLGLLWYAGLGVTLYGVAYFIVHDGLVHRRVRIPLRQRGKYIRRLIQAHRLHHASPGRDGAVSFGFLYALEPRRLTAQLRATHAARPRASASEHARRAARHTTPTRQA